MLTSPPSATFRLRRYRQLQPALPDACPPPASLTGRVALDIARPWDQAADHFVHGRRRELHRAGDVCVRHRQPGLVDPEHDLEVLLLRDGCLLRLPPRLLLGSPNQVRLICRSLTAIQKSLRRHWPLYLGGLLVALLAWSAFDAHGGTSNDRRRPPQPRRGGARQRAARLPRGAGDDPRPRRGHRQHGRHEPGLPPADRRGSRRRIPRQRRHLVPRRPWSGTFRRRRLEGAGRDGAAGGHRPPRGHELVLPQGLLDRLDVDATRKRKT